ncbi:MAG: hypothetical protein KAI24_00525 [Planctomycetes bacterium]|nr:hypothetical protein [Planctomycetota bacterium]
MHRARLLLLLLVTGPLAGVPLLGQDLAAPDAPPPRVIVVQNLAPHARRQPAACVVPFAPGLAFDSPGLTVEEQTTTWQPFGARWPDGSWRQALCLFRVDIPPLSEQRLTLLAGRSVPKPLRIEMPAAKLEVVVRRGRDVVRAEPERVRDLENNAMRRVELRRARVGATGLVVELIVTAWREQPFADVSVAVFFSDPDSKDLQRHVDELAIECRGMGLVLRHGGYLGMRQGATPYGSRTVLLRDAALADGQGLRRVGALVPPLTGDRVVDETLRAVTIAPLLAATSWRETGAFGPFGHVPPPPPWLQGDALRVHFALRHKTFVQRERPGGDPFDVFPHGLQRMAGQTGDQADFGTCKLSPVAWSGVPSMLLEVELSVLQEACRPVHFFEQDGAPVDPAEHPEWVVWSGRTHWHREVSVDRLGKPHPEPAFDSHGWTGKDRQHWSSNYLSAYALLTGAHWARRELENEARLYLAGQTLDPKLTTSNAGAPRGVGRTLLSAAWNLCVTDDDRLRERMHARTDRVHAEQWAGRTLGADRVRPMSVSGPDDRLLRGKHPFWNPWQDALAAVGLAAHHRMTGNANARRLAEALATNVVRHGWLVDERGCEVAMAMRWLDGRPFTAEQWRSRDETLVQWGFGTAYSEWSIGAVEIARVAAARDGDEELRSKAAGIQQQLRAGRRRPAAEYPYLGGFDRFGEWDAVRWEPQ